MPVKLEILRATHRTGPCGDRCARPDHANQPFKHRQFANQTFLLFLCQTVTPTTSQKMVPTASSPDGASQCVGFRSGLLGTIDHIAAQGLEQLQLSMVFEAQIKRWTACQ